VAYATAEYRCSPHLIRDNCEKRATAIRLCGAEMLQHALVKPTRTSARNPIPVIDLVHLRFSEVDSDQYAPITHDLKGMAIVALRSIGGTHCTLIAGVHWLRDRGRAHAHAGDHAAPCRSQVRRVLPSTAEAQYTATRRSVYCRYCRALRLQHADRALHCVERP
jgi:hypothetical protein